LAYFEWSAPDDADLDDMGAWAQANPGLGIRIRPDAIATMRAALDERGFAREHLGIWHDPRAHAVIDPTLWSTLVVDRAEAQSQLDKPVVFAVDVSPDRRRASVAVAHKRRDGLFHVDVAHNELGTDWVVGTLAGMVERNKPAAVLLDSAGPAGALLPQLHNSFIEVTDTSSRQMTQACGMFFDLVESRRLRHLDGSALNTALGAARKRPLGDAWAWHRKDATADITPLVAATLALYGVATVTESTGLTRVRGRVSAY
jgi:hypothetical protein